MPKSPQPEVMSRAAGRFVEYDQFIDEQLDKTSGHVRSVDITGSLLTLLAGLVGFFFLAALADHWLIPGGLGFWGRLIAWTTLLGGSGYYFVREILPLLLHRINPVYAAQTIEHGTPGLKNGLVNFLLLKKHRTSITEPVFQAIEAQAAMGLAHTPIETAIDRSRLIKIGYALAALLLVGGAYKILSPKDPFRTIGRVVLPWANIAPSTRVTILGVEPGSINVFRGEQVAIKVDVRGMPKDGEAKLIYSTGDAQAVDQHIRLIPSAEGLSYSCTLPEASAGVQQDLRYHIEAGDARSDDFTISMVTAPTIVVQSQDLVFPEYTGLTPQHIEHQGDVKGIEGARVTLHALANQPIKTGGIDFDCNNREDKPLSIRRDSAAKGQEATGEFTLALTEDRKAQQYTSYQLLFRNEAGKQNPQPATHRIEVVPDLPPEIEFLHPKSVDLDVPAGASVGMEITASDPDFALRRVRLIVALDGREIHESVLLDETHRGQFNKKQRFRTAHTTLKPGDVVEYWAVAEDNKTPEANRVETPRRRLRIGSPQQQPPQGDQLAKNDEDVQFDNPKNDKQNKNPQDENSKNADKPLAADAQNEADRSPEKPSRDRQGADDGSRSDDTKRRNQEPSRDIGDEPQPSDKPSASDDKNDERQPGEKNGEQQPQDGKNGQQGADQQSGGGGQGQKGAQDSQQQGGGSSGSGSSDGDNKSGDGQSGGKSGGKNSGDKQSGGAASDKDAGENSGDGKGDSSSDGGAKGQAGSTKADAGKSGSDKSNSSKKMDGGAGDAGDQQPVAKDGVDDGSAIERIVKHQEDHKENSPGDKQGAGGDKPKGAGEKGSNDKGSNDKGANDKGNEPPKGEPGKGPKPANAQQRGKDPKSGQPEPGASGDKQNQDKTSQGKQDKANDPAAGDPKNASDAQKNDADSPQQPGQGDQGQKDQGQQKKDQGQQGKNGQGDKGQGEKGQGEKGQGEKGQGEQGQGEDGQGSQGQGKQENPGGKDGKSEGGTDGKGSGKSQNKGDSDGGKTPGGKEGSPEAQGDNAPPSQSQHGGKSNEQKGQDDQPQSPSNSHKQDKSKGQTTDANSGDRSGNGGKGGGQPGKKPGKGEPGQGMESDDGDGRADSPGAGEDSARPGTDKKSDRPTGKPGKEQGSGSTSRKGQGDAANSQKPSSPPDSADQGDSSDGKDGADRDGAKPDQADRQSPNKNGQPDKNKSNKNGKADKPSDKQPPDSPQAGEPGDDAPKPKSGQDQRKPPGNQQPKAGDGADGGKSPSADEKGDQAGDEPGGAGQPGGGQPGQDGPSRNADDRPAAPPPPSNAGEAPKGDDPNLDYARQATDLALERLKDQMARGETDQALLDKLGWSQRDLEKFMDRWERMRSEANQNGKRGTAARQQLDDTLRSLGLRPRNASVKAEKGRDDHSRGMKESRRTAPPAEYADQVKAYTEGASRGGDGK